MRPTWLEGKCWLTWPNGARAYFFSGATPELLRGAEAELLVIDELASMPYGEEVLAMAGFGLRSGPYRRMLVATTPRSLPWLKKFVKRQGTAVTHSTTWDNIHLPAVRLAQLREEWEGRTLALQEIEGLFVESNAEALFREEWFLHHEVPTEMIERVAIGVDPSGGADEIGIVACALLTDDRFAVLTDRSLKSTPAKWGEAVVKLATNSKRSTSKRRSYARPTMVVR